MHTEIGGTLRGARGSRSGRHGRLPLNLRQSRWRNEYWLWLARMVLTIFSESSEVFLHEINGMPVFGAVTGVEARPPVLNEVLFRCKILADQGSSA